MKGIVKIGLATMILAFTTVVVGCSACGHAPMDKFSKFSKMGK
jgi:hypothetical protein